MSPLTRIACSACIVCAAALRGTAEAAPLLHVHDSGGNLGTVDLATGDVNVIGSMGVVMTDIAFDADGRLLGLSFSGLYEIDPDSAASTFIGFHDVPTGNALVFGVDGTLYGAGGGSQDLYTIDPATAATTSVVSMAAFSAGDLAFFGDDLFLSSTSDDLVSIDLSAGGSIVGPFGVPAVYGLATVEGTMYAIANTSVYEVDVTTGDASFLLDFGGQGLGSTNGGSYFLEEVPAPSSLVVLLAAGGVCSGRRRRVSSKPQTPRSALIRN